MKPEKQPERPDRLSEFERFRALTRDLLGVPKKQIDRELAKYEAKKKRRRRT